MLTLQTPTDECIKLINNIVICIREPKNAKFFCSVVYCNNMFNNNVFHIIG